MSPARTCARDGCDRSLEGKRRDARFCGPDCRRAAWGSRQERKAFRTPFAGAERLPDGRYRLRIGPCLEFDLPADFPERSRRFWRAMGDLR
jgi:hypothetical protein